MPNDCTIWRIRLLIFAQLCPPNSTFICQFGAELLCRLKMKMIKINLTFKIRFDERTDTYSNSIHGERTCIFRMSTERNEGCKLKIDLDEKNGSLTR